MLSKMEIEVATKHQGLILQNRWAEQPGIPQLTTQYSTQTRVNVNNMNDTFIVNNHL